MIKKARVIVLGTGAATRKFILDNVANRYIEIMGIILDGSVEADDNKVLRILNFPDIVSVASIIKPYPCTKGLTHAPI